MKHEPSKLRISDFDRRSGKTFMDVTLRVRVLLPKKMKYPMRDKPWMWVTFGKSVEPHNFTVLSELSSPASVT